MALVCRYLSLFVLLFSFASAYAEPSVVVRTVPPSVSLGEPFRLEVIVDDAETADVPDAPVIDGADVQFAGRSTGMRSEMVTVNGRASMVTAYTVTFTFAVNPKRTGELVIPEMNVAVGGKTFTTQAQRVQVLPPQHTDAVRLRVEVDNTEPYVGQPVNLRVTLLFNRGLASDPLFQLPGVEDHFNVLDTGTRPSPDERNVLDLLGTRSQVNVQQTVDNGVPYNRVILTRTLIPTSPGQFTIGPSSITTQIVLSEGRGFFESARTRAVTADSPAITFNVKPLPDAGKPSNFNGLVGVYNISTSASPTAINVGDPINLIVTLKGPGLHDRISSPVSASTPGFEGRFRVTGNTSKPTLAGDSLVWTLTVRPTASDVNAIPVIELPYFDPTSGKYEIARSQPVPLEVRATRVVTAGDAVGNTPTTAVGEVIETRTSGLAANKESMDTLIDQRFDLVSSLTTPSTLIVLGAPPIAYASIVLVRVARRRSATNGHAARSRRVIPEALATIESAPTDDPHACASAVSVALRRAIASVVHHVGSPESLTPQEAQLKLASRDQALGKQAHDVLARCDAARFGGLSGGDAQTLRHDAATVVRSLTHLRGAHA